MLVKLLVFLVFTLASATPISLPSSQDPTARYRELDSDPHSVSSKGRDLGTIFKDPVLGVFNARTGWDPSSGRVKRDPPVEPPTNGFIWGPQSSGDFSPFPL